jgi:hypothetical protein
MRVLLTSLAAAAFSLGVLAQAPPAILARLGPQVGQRVPDFSLPDQDGRTRDLTSVAGPNGTMLVFFRSADW